MVRCCSIILVMHPARLVLVALSAQTAAAPGYFFPDEKSQLVAEPQNDAGLLIVPQADKVGTHLFYLLHFGAHHLFGQGSAYSGMVFMAVGAAQQQPFAVQVERPFLFEAEMAEAEVLGGARGISVVDKFCHAGVESGRVGLHNCGRFREIWYEDISVSSNDMELTSLPSGEKTRRENSFAFFSLPDSPPKAMSIEILPCFPFSSVVASIRICSKWTAGV